MRAAVAGHRVLASRMVHAIKAWPAAQKDAFAVNAALVCLLLYGAYNAAMCARKKFALSDERTAALPAILFWCRKLCDA